MIRHSLTLEHVARCLNDRLSGTILTEAWTQEKNIAMLRMEHPAGGDPLIVRISVDADTGSFRIDQASARARKNTLDIFPTLIGATCGAVVKIDGDRIITLFFDTGSLHVQLFSGGMGNVFLERAGIIVDALSDRAAHIGHPFTVHARPLTLGSFLENEQQHRDDVVAAWRESRTAYLLEHNGSVVFSMLPLHGMTILETSSDVLSLLQRAVVERFRRTRLDKVRTELLKGYDREIRKLTKALEAMRSDAAQADRAAERRMIGDLLMSHHEPRARDLASIDLTTWEGEPITVKLDPKKTIIDNAQDYYAKARNAEAAAAERQQRIPKTERRLNELTVLRERVAGNNDVTELERLLKRPMSTQGPTPETLPYRVFQLDDEHTLYVGKRAANNDQLTMRFAKQNDWWFHARGSSGSHCVLRGPGNVKPPKAILEAAAAIAAYYSGSRNASWTPVVYTQRKNVRKPKGSNVGAVVLDREEVIMVKPGLPPEATSTRS